MAPETPPVMNHSPTAAAAAAARDRMRVHTQLAPTTGGRGHVTARRAKPTDSA